MTFGQAIRGIFAKSNGYAAVRERNNGRNPVGIERKTEDEMLKGRKRTQLIATHREAFRNTTFSPATALQLQINVVGTTGGKLTVIGKDGGIDEQATKAFRHWAKHAEFTRGTSLNELLRMLLTQLTHIGGDFIAVLDCGELTHADDPSLRVKIFEPDQIRNIKDGLFKRLYPNGEYTQIGGLVRDKFDRIVSAFVGNSRDNDEFGEGEFIQLKPLTRAGDFSDSNWIHIGVFDRPNQGRGISPLAHIANNLDDLAAIQASEIQAAKINSGLGLILTDTETDVASAEDTRAWDNGGNDSGFDGVGGADNGNGGDDEAYEAELEAAENAALKQASNNLREGQSAIVKLGANRKLESFKIDRPNLNVIEMYDRIGDVSGSVLGLSPMFSRLKVQGSYSGARTEMVLARPVFEMWQKLLERNFLDWLAVRVLNALGFDSRDLEDRLLWSWAKREEVDEGANETATQKKFLNGEINLIDIHGADTEQFLDRRAAEERMCKERGLIPPWGVSVAGAQLQTPDATNEGKEDIDGED